ncbi:MULTISPECIES: sensor histidine kinase [unclassified Rathayibacter]|uniref:sensor histidine kinase n=1 Tax=unclassified Rathayibacter TaxID=2609250 RepID=UPI00188A672C|nr:MULTISPECIES: histidine kinase [unclassified Rathayibacter]MBF4462892.1 hypothetical protein [Rathayibacter sp. VKM Ac-2879]MBF4504306.1 hypothetical protein [Rathayibacter sp. VKM Ac-2878]
MSTTPWLERPAGGLTLMSANLVVGLAVFSLVAPRLPLWNLLLTLAIGLAAILPLGVQRRRPRTAGVAAIVGSALTPLATPAMWTALVVLGLRLPPRTTARFIVAGALANGFLLGLYIVRWATPETLGASILVGVFSMAVTVVIGVSGVLAGVKRRSDRAANERLLVAFDRRAADVERSRDGERERIASEIHDSLGHSLTLLSLHSAALRDVESLSTRELRILSESIELQTRMAIDSLTATLRAAPAPGLTEAAVSLEALFAGVQATGRALDVQVVGDPGALSAEAAVLLVRFCREGLTNALKHSAAGPLGVAVRIDEGGGVVAAVTSPERGVDEGTAPAMPSTERGLRDLGAAASALGGEVVLTREDGLVTVSLRVPEALAVRWP